MHLTLLGFNTVAIRSISSGFCGGESIFAKKGNFRALLIVRSQVSIIVVNNVIH